MASLPRRLAVRLARLFGIAPAAPPPAPERQDKHLWTIGLLEGPSPLALASARVPQPILRGEAVQGVDAAFVADPFLVPDAHGAWLFFELYNTDRAKGEIGVARTDDWRTFTGARVVLRQDVHLSYPCVFTHEGAWYMIPETHEARAVRLYRASAFPDGWELVATLLEGAVMADATPLLHDGRWYLFVDASPAKRHETLRLYHADALTGPWTEHPASPLLEGAPTHARPAGKLVRHDGRLYRFAQDCVPHYGMAVRAFEVRRLDATGYAEVPVALDPPLAGSGAGWNAAGMHHVDAHPRADGSWVAVTDGWRWASMREVLRR